MIVDSRVMVIDIYYDGVNINRKCFVEVTA